MAFRLLQSGLVSRGAQVAYRTAFVPRFISPALPSVGGAPDAHQLMTRRTFISGLVKKLRERLEQDPDYQKNKKEWDSHLEQNPDLKQKLDKVSATAAKTKDAVASGAKATVSAVGTAASKVGEGAGKLGSAVADSKAAEVVSKAAETVSQSAVGQTVGRVVDTTVRDLMREGSVYPTRVQIAAPVVDPSAAAAGADAAAAAAAGGDTAAATAAPGADAEAGATDAAAAAGGAAPAAEPEYRNARAVTAKPRTTWERLQDHVKGYESSKNPFLRAAFGVGSRVASVADKLGGLMSETEMAGVIREARKQDPTFTPDVFIRYVRSSIPLLFKAAGEGDTAMLHEFAAGSALKELTQVAMERNVLGYKLDTRTLDIEHIEVCGCLYCLTVCGSHWNSFNRAQWKTIGSH
jgi:hypothetical protein